jgi:hypothetical protein
MHENRETFEASRSNQDRDLSEKALCRTVDGQVSEESDCVVLPVNQSNKEDPSSAEIGEGRTQAKENIAISNAHPTQSGKGVSQGLRGVRGVAIPGSFKVTNTVMLSVPASSSEEQDVLRLPTDPQSGFSLTEELFVVHDLSLFGGAGSESPAPWQPQG